MEDEAGLSGMLSKPDGTVHTMSAPMLPKRNDSPIRTFTRPQGDGKISSVLLGAGDDPMSLNCDFSSLASNPALLMRTRFSKPQSATTRFPPVIDPFSRTLAAPISSQRHYLSVCHKIGTNFTPTAKGFYVDTDLRCVKFKDVDEGVVKLNIVSDNAQ